MCRQGMFEQSTTCMLRLVLCCRQRGFRSLERVDLLLPCFHTRLQLLGPLKGREPVGASQSATRSQTHKDKEARVEVCGKR